MQRIEKNGYQKQPAHWEPAAGPIEKTGGRRRRPLRAMALVLTAVLLASTGLYLWHCWRQYKALTAQRPMVEIAETVRTAPGFLPVQKVSKNFINPLLATEDRRFYTRSGFDFRALGRALWVNLQAMRLIEGGSTIPQQVAKLWYFDNRNTVTDKVIQMFMLYELEAKFTKDEILSFYLNGVNFGGDFTGLSAASRGYFGVEPSQLTIAQGSLLAGLLQAPNAYYPFTHLDKAKDRQLKVLQNMVDVNMLTQSEADRIRLQPLHLLPAPPSPKTAA